MVAVTVVVAGVLGAAGGGLILLNGLLFPLVGGYVPRFFDLVVSGARLGYICVSVAGGAGDALGRACLFF